MAEHERRRKAPETALQRLARLEGLEETSLESSEVSSTETSSECIEWDKDKSWQSEGAIRPMKKPEQRKTKSLPDILQNEDKLMELCWKRADMYVNEFLQNSRDTYRSEQSTDNSKTYSQIYSEVYEESRAREKKAKKVRKAYRNNKAKLEEISNSETRGSSRFTERTESWREGETESNYQTDSTRSSFKEFKNIPKRQREEYNFNLNLKSRSSTSSNSAHKTYSKNSSNFNQEQSIYSSKFPTKTFQDRANSPIIFRQESTKSKTVGLQFPSEDELPSTKLNSPQKILGLQIYNADEALLEVPRDFKGSKILLDNDADFLDINLTDDENQIHSKLMAAALTNKKSSLSLNKSETSILSNESICSYTPSYIFYRRSDSDLEKAEKERELSPQDDYVAYLADKTLKACSKIYNEEFKIKTVKRQASEIPLKVDRHSLAQEFNKKLQRQLKLLSESFQ